MCVCVCVEDIDLFSSVGTGQMTSFFPWWGVSTPEGLFVFQQSELQRTPLGNDRNNLKSITSLALFGMFAVHVLYYMNKNLG